MQVVKGILVVNPGSVSKPKGPGTYIQLTIHPRKVTDEERMQGTKVGHNLFDRARVDIVKI